MGLSCTPSILIVSNGNTAFSFTQIFDGKAAGAWGVQTFRDCHLDLVETLQAQDIPMLGDYAHPIWKDRIQMVAVPKIGVESLKRFSAAHTIVIDSQDSQGLDKVLLRIDRADGSYKAATGVHEPEAHIQFLASCGIAAKRGSKDYDLVIPAAEVYKLKALQDSSAF